jgi:hypothetical protein
MKTGTESGSKTLDQAGSAHVGDAGQRSSAPQRPRCGYSPDTSAGNLASALVSTGCPTTRSRPNRGVVSLRHSVFGSKGVGMSMLGSIDGVLVRAATRVPSPFGSARLRRLPA